MPHGGKSNHCCVHSEPNTVGLAVVSAIPNCTDLGVLIDLHTVCGTTSDTGKNATGASARLATPGDREDMVGGVETEGKCHNHFSSLTSQTKQH